MSRKLKEIMKMKREDREIELRKYAKGLGCSLQGTYTDNGVHLEQEVICRIRAAEEDLEKQNSIELKPNVFGIGIDFFKFLGWVKNKWREK